MTCNKRLRNLLSSILVDIRYRWYRNVIDLHGPNSLQLAFTDNLMKNGFILRIEGAASIG
jgi:hypothetical protein